MAERLDGSAALHRLWPHPLSFFFLIIEDHAPNIWVCTGFSVHGKGITSDHLFLRPISSSFKLLDDSFFLFSLKFFTIIPVYLDFNSCFNKGSNRGLRFEQNIDWLIGFLVLCRMLL